MKTPYPLSIIKSGVDNGVIALSNNISQSYRIEVADFNGNTSKIFVPIQYSALPAKIAEIPITSKYFVKAKKENIFSLENVTVNFPSNTFYDDFYMNFEIKNGMLKLHEDIVPAHTNFSITFEDSIIPEKEREKMFIGLIKEKKISYYNTKRYKNSFKLLIHLPPIRLSLLILGGIPSLINI